MKKYLFSILSLFIIGCTTSQKPAVETVAQRPSLVAEKRKILDAAKAPLKGRFLDYIYQIQPDHKQPGYSVSTQQLNNGYAYGSGPYDGLLLEFFLFRGEQLDIVVKQSSGPEAKDFTFGPKNTYGPQLDVYSFTNKKMKKENIKYALNFAKADVLFDQQIDKMKKLPMFFDWQYYRLVRMPNEGTTVQLKVCRTPPQPPFTIKTTCALIGTIRWNKKQFQTHGESLTPSEEVI